MLPVEVYNKIGSYLPLIEQYCISIMSKDTKKFSDSIGFNIQSEFKKYFIKNIKNTVSNPEDLCVQLKNNNCVVSGSYILDCLYGTNYSSDIDIFKNVNNGINQDVYCTRTLDIPEQQHLNSHLYEFKSYLAKIGAKQNEIPELHDDDNSGYCGRGYNPNGPGYNVRCILLNVSNYILNDKTIQFISITKDYREYIDTVFDLDICKNFFDGEKLYIKNIDKLVKKYDAYKPINSVCKYLYNPNLSEQNNLSRMGKYIQRGFDIKKHDKFSEIKQRIDEKVNIYKLSIEQHSYRDNRLDNIEQSFNDMYNELLEIAKL